MKWKLKCFLFHIAVSAVIFLILSVLILKSWYPDPYFNMTGVGHLVLFILFVDVILGPFVTLIVSSDKKSHREMIFDFLVIGMIQLAALGYGINILARTKPIAIVYEVDRFRVVGYSDIYCENACDEYSNYLNFSPVKIVGLREPKDGQEKLESIFTSIQGVEPSQRPTWWQDYILNKKDVLLRANDLNLIYEKYQISEKDLYKKIHPLNRKIDLNDVKWMPLTGRNVVDWIVLVDKKNADLIGFVNLDGFFIY